MYTVAAFAGASGFATPAQYDTMVNLNVGHLYETWLEDGAFEHIAFRDWLYKLASQLVREQGRRIRVIIPESFVFTTWHSRYTHQISATCLDATYFGVHTQLIYLASEVLIDCGTHLYVRKSRTRLSGRYPTERTRDLREW